MDALHLRQPLARDWPLRDGGAGLELVDSLAQPGDLARVGCAALAPAVPAVILPLTCIPVLLDLLDPHLAPPTAVPTLSLLPAVNRPRPRGLFQTDRRRPGATHQQRSCCVCGLSLV